MIDTEFIDCFVEELDEYLETWKKEVDNLKAESGDLESIYRVNHNMKGSSMAMGLENFSNFAKALEELIVPLKNGEINANPQVIEFLEECFHFYSEWKSKLEAEPEYNPDTSAILAKMHALI